MPQPNQKKAFNVLMKNPKDIGNENIDSKDLYLSISVKNNQENYDSSFENFSLVQKFSQKNKLELEDYLKLVVHVLESKCVHPDNDNFIARNIISLTNYATYVDMMSAAGRDVSQMKKEFLETADREKNEGLSLIDKIEKNVKIHDLKEESDLENDKEQSSEFKDSSFNNKEHEANIKDNNHEENIDSKKNNQDNEQQNNKSQTGNGFAYSDEEYRSQFESYQQYQSQEQDFESYHFYQEDNMEKSNKYQPLPSDEIPLSEDLESKESKAKASNEDFVEEQEIKKVNDPMADYKSAMEKEKSLSDRMKSEIIVHKGKEMTLETMKNNSMRYGIRHSNGDDQAMNFYYEQSMHKIFEKLKKEGREDLGKEFLNYGGVKSKSLQDLMNTSNPSGSYSV